MNTSKSSFTDMFIKKPVLALVVNLLIVILGVQALRSLSVRQFPRMDDAQIVVTTAYIGASAELVRGFITTPLEQSIAAADGIDYLSSSSMQGVSKITARLKLNYDANKALAEITARVNQVRGDLPPEAELPIIMIESSESAYAAGYLCFTSDIMAPNEITDYLVRVVQTRLSALDGVQRAEIFGARTFAMRVWLRPDRMASLGVSPSMVRTALGTNNYLSAVGTTKGALVQVNLVANTDLRTVAEFKDLVILEKDGAIVRLSDVADVELGAEDYSTSFKFGTKDTVGMAIYVLPTSNVLDVMKLVKEEMKDIEANLPVGLEAAVAYDSTEYIQNAIFEVLKTLGETLLIVVIVIFLFLGRIRSTLVPVVAIPLSLIGTIFLMQAFGFTVNLLTLLAIVLSVGLVVDDAIVVVENVDRHMNEGKTPFDAALLGARELVSPIISMTIVLAAVYAPIGLQGGLTGALFREFAFTLAGAVTISGVVAVTLSPMMSSKLLKSGMDEKGFAGVINRGFEKLKHAYSKIVDFTLRTRVAVYVVWVVLTLAAVGMYMFSMKELAPSEDYGFLFHYAQTPATGSLEQTEASGKALSEYLAKDPDTEQFFVIEQPTLLMAGQILKPWKTKRTVPAYQIIPRMQTLHNKLPAVKIFASNVPPLPGGGFFPVEFVISSTADVQEMLPLANEIARRCAESGKFQFPPIVDVQYDQPQAEIVIDREKVAMLGLNLQEVGADLGAAVGGNYVNRFNISGRSYKVIPQIKRENRLNAEQLKDIYIRGSHGKLIPLGAIATIKTSTVPRMLNRFQQLNSVTIQGAPMVGLDEALSFLETACKEVLPKGYKIDYTGESRQLRTEGNKFVPAFLLALSLIFLVLAAQFNSFRDPLIILTGSVPLAMFGALLFSFLKFPVEGVPFFTNGWTTSMNIYSQVGLVTLVGIVSKNGILIVEFANKMQETGMPKLRAIREAALTRFRPILMTSAATIIGHFPLTLVSGEGAAARNSIGITIVAGMAIGTIFTLFVTPALYMLIAKDREAERRRDAKIEAERAALEAGQLKTGQI